MRRYERGESSRRSDSSNEENERPFKKAKYVWQLKGKYHLKERYKYANADESSSKRSTANEERREKDEKETRLNCDENSSKSCSRCLSTLIAHSNTLLENENDLSDREDGLNADQSIYDDVPVSMVRPKRENHDEFLQKWQARQVAKSFIDNTINTILEQWKLAPAEATEFVENCDNGQVEDEGIMMAIQSHGLQSNTTRYPVRPYGGSATSSNIINTCTSNNYVQESSENFRNKQFECLDGKDRGVDVAGDRSVSGNDTEQMDFLSTAVTMAIQNKGLSSYSYG